MCPVPKSRCPSSRYRRSRELAGTAPVAVHRVPRVTRGTTAVAGKVAGLVLLATAVASCSTSTMGTNQYRWTYITDGGRVVTGQSSVCVGDAERGPGLANLLACEDGLLIQQWSGAASWFAAGRYVAGRPEGQHVKLSAVSRKAERRCYRSGQQLDGTWWYASGGLWCAAISNECGYRLTMWTPQGDVWSDYRETEGRRDGGFPRWERGGEPLITWFSNGLPTGETSPTNAIHPPAGRFWDGED
jgi:hypothetical protein